MSPDFALGLSIGSLAGLAVGQASALGLFYVLWRLAADPLDSYLPEDRDAR